MRDHIHMCISVAPKYAVSIVMGNLKGKSAISIAKKFRAKKGARTILTLYTIQIPRQSSLAGDSLFKFRYLN